MQKACALAQASGSPIRYKSLARKELLRIGWRRTGRRSRRGWRWNHTLLHNRRRRSRIGNPLDAFLETLQTFAQSFAQFRQTLGAEKQKRKCAHDQQVPRLKKIHFILRASGTPAAHSQQSLSHKATSPRRIPGISTGIYSTPQQPIRMFPQRFSLFPVPYSLPQFTCAGRPNRSTTIA